MACFRKSIGSPSTPGAPGTWHSPLSIAHVPPRRPTHLGSGRLPGGLYLAFGGGNRSTRTRASVAPDSLNAANAASPDPEKRPSAPPKYAVQSATLMLSSDLFSALYATQFLCSSHVCLGQPPHPAWPPTHATLPVSNVGIHDMPVYPPRN